MYRNPDAFIRILNEFYDNLQDLPLETLLEKPENIAIISVDVTNAFCRTGNLASDRIEAIINPIVSIFNKAWKNGLRKILLLHDCHTPGSEEFSVFAEHALCGTIESEAVDEIKSLPFYDEMTIIEKNSIHPAHGTLFNNWIESNTEISTFIIVGDCTDLCVYQTAMHLRTTANANGIIRRIIIPEECVNTYDLSPEIAESVNAVPHPGDFLHRLFLYHMCLNGIEIKKRLS